MTEKQNETEKYPPYTVTPCSVCIKDVPLFLNTLATIGLKMHYHIVLLRKYYIAGPRHIETAIKHAVRSFHTKPIAKTLEIEILLFIAATRQTGRISLFGVQEGKNDCYICLIPRITEKQVEPWNLLQEAGINLVIDTSMNPDCAEISNDINNTRFLFFMDQYDITSEELTVIGENRLEDLVCERVALLSIEK
ncbi:MAG: KEOPS complex subunit Cgi121 [Euryarchaeota archaeon]|nr:KEOPS complex subunit Cgi121 [Euryarchaeota archaeon]